MPLNAGNISPANARFAKRCGQNRNAHKGREQ